MAKENISKMKRESTIWENIFVSVTSDKGLISKIYEELTWLHLGRQTTQLKNGQRIWTKEDIHRAQRYMKGFSASLAIREMQIKIILRHHLISVRIAINNKSTNKGWWGCGEKGTLVHCWWECRCVQPLWKTVWNFLRKLKMELPFDPTIPLLGLYPKNPETPIQKNLCTPMFIAAQFTIAK